MDNTRILNLYEQYGLDGCISDISLLQAMYADIHATDIELVEEDVLWLYENIGACNETEAGVKRARVLDVVAGDILRVMACGNEVCRISFPESYLIHLEGVTLPEDPAKYLENFRDQIVDIKEIGVNEFTGVMEARVWSNGASINATLAALTPPAEEVDPGIIAFTEVYSVNPKSFIAGDNVWVNAMFENVGTGRGKYRYYLGVVLTDRDGTEWTYAGEDNYATYIDVGTPKELRVNFDVPTYMDAPIGIKFLLYKTTGKTS